MKKKRTGGSRARLAAVLLLAAGMPVMPRAASGVGPAAKEKKPQLSYALIAGTVFRDTGFALPGAEVTLTPVREPGSKVKAKTMKLASDSRGEFAFRVPAEPMRYTVAVKAAGFRPQEKSVSIGGDERQDLFFRLEPDTR